jgi:hypothetical protein
MSTQLPYQQCTHCILDTNDDATITFDGIGVCNYCRTYREDEKKHVPDPAQARVELEKWIAKIKQEGKDPMIAF